MMSELPENSESPQKAVAQPPLVRLSRQEQLSLKIGDTLWFSDYGDMKHCYEYQIKKLTNGRAVSGISLRDAKRKDVHVFRANSQDDRPNGSV